MIISQIVAVSINNVIGKDNALPWHMPSDSKYFKEKTWGHHIVTGRRNYEAEGKALAGRINIVLSRNPNYLIPDGVMVKQLQKAMEIAKNANENELFIVGGEEIYKLAMPVTDRIYLTRIHVEVDGDTYYPPLDLNIWKEVSKVENLKDNENPYNFDYLIYERK